MPAPTPAHKGPRQPRRVWFVRDPLGLACAAATWLLLPGGCAVLLRELLGPARGGADGGAHGALSLALAGLALAAHARTLLTDPGALPVGAGSGLGAEPGGPRCSVCDLVRPPGAHHCPVCGRCIRRVDHHCPWVNNCVGEDNRKFFLLFTLYTALAALHALLLLGVPALRGYAHGRLAPRAPLLFLLLAALYGFLFAAVMLALQLGTVCTDRTARARGERGWRAAWMNLKDALGHPPSLAWLSPFASPRPPRPSARDRVV
ncbi:palmitoyltransferase ZDHHC3-like [Myotis myotis]|uniref:palmitoyltransferase ZDHHC3-like n=1 Tax=Myotis myotis TaxID=51298 RepID=UPI001749C505|nr:palmitoyltransferase ZDHHC3-like [Myotis myotis]